MYSGAGVLQTARRTLRDAVPRTAPFSTRSGFNHLLNLASTCALLALVAALFLVCGCSRQDSTADIVIVNGNEPESLDPVIAVGISEMRITKALFEGLLRLDPKTAEPVPGLAEKWDISADGKVYTFYLRTNAAWSTGEPITTEDVRYSWLRALHPDAGAYYAGQLFYIKNAEPFNKGQLKDPGEVGIRALDRTRFQVELEHPLAFFLDVCTFPTLAVVPRSVIELHGDRWLHQRPLPCSGPYELVTWRLNDKVRLHKNIHYWDVANTQNDVIDILPIGSPNSALNLYETGIADIVWDKDLIPVELLDVLIKRPDFHSFNYLGTYFYRFNVNRKPLDDPRVRKAFALVTDRERIIQKLTKGGEKPAYHFVPDGVARYEPAEGLPLNVQEARRLLAEAGFPDGKGFPRLQYSFYSAASGGAKMQAKIAIELQHMWREGLGIDIELRQIERTIFHSLQSRLEYDISASSWIGDYNDANTFLDLFMSDSLNNRTGWKNARYDTLIHQANLNTDARARAQLLKQAEQVLIAEEAPIIPIYFYAGFNYFDSKRITGIYQNLLDEHPLQYIRKLDRRDGAPRPPTSSVPGERSPNRLGNDIRSRSSLVREPAQFAKAPPSP